MQVSKCRVFSGPYFSEFSPNTGKKDYKEFRIQTFFTLFTLSFMEKKHFVCFSLYLEVALSSFGFYFVFKHGS